MYQQSVYLIYLLHKRFFKFVWILSKTRERKAISTTMSDRRYAKKIDETAGRILNGIPPRYKYLPISMF
jgi:hypothetical protein